MRAKRAGGASPVRPLRPPLSKRFHAATRAQSFCTLEPAGAAVLRFQGYMVKFADRGT
ncbi:MAG: hypothetical protein LKCHEGNO_03592 [Burkholderiaceae bacterium]|nr:hypothetical protein [Burkholderiaceae bacterium]